MKKFSLFAFAAAGLLLGACSSDNDAVVKGGSANGYDLIPGQNSWLAVGIALPDGGSTRANEDLVDGLSTEFEVKSAKLILFKGGTEATATYFGEYDLTPSFSDEANDNVPEGNQEGTTASGYGEITSTSTRYVTEIENPDLGAEDKLWAYAILNYDGNATGVRAEGKTFATFSQDILTAIGIANEAKGQGAIGSNGLVMTSVPIASAPGGVSAPAANTEITTLSQVQSDAIFETKEEAAKETNPLTCIYVERAAVKVELKNSVEKLKDEETDFEVLGWYLGNVNNNASGYYNTRQVDAAWNGYFNETAPANTKYRMIGRTGFWNSDAHNPTGYRTYFGKDVNYSGNTGLINNTLTDNDYVEFNNDGANITYTYENTVDENSMIYEYTTYVGVKAQIGDGSDFWVEEGKPNTKLDGEEEIGMRVKANASTTFDNAVAAINAAISADLSAADANDPTVSTSTIIAAAEVEKNEIDEVSYTLDAEVTLGSVDANTAEQEVTYQIVINGITAKKSGTAVTLTEAQQTAVENAVKNLAGVAEIIGALERTTDAKFYKYTGGVSYYSMRIAHFGGYDLPSGDKDFANGETPWTAPSEAYNNYEKCYPMDGQSLHATPINYGASRAAAWLGRWSIVRNNWYVLDIKGVEGLGSPVPEDYSGNGIGKTPDDNPGRKYYIAAEIHILPWAKRYQSVQF